MVRVQAPEPIFTLELAQENLVLYSSASMLATFLSLSIALLAVQTPTNGKISQADIPAQRRTAQYSSQDISQLQAQADQGDPTAELRLARAYDDGNGVPKNEQNAVKWYRKAAEQGNSDAQNSLGEMYLNGEGVEQNKHQAVLWYDESARQGNANAMYNLGTAYYNGDGVGIDDSLSYAWFTLARESGNQKAADAVQRADSQLQVWAITAGFKKIAEMYEIGEHLPKSQAEAAHWWLKAATRGDSDARIEIANKLLAGEGVAQDFTQARYWCNEATKAGGARGEWCIGYLYEHGLGITRDPKEARKWYERTAALRNHQALNALAQMDATGEGGKIDRISACLLYLKLAALGDSDALRSLAKLKKQMDAKAWKNFENQLTYMYIDAKKLNTALQQVDSQ